MLKRRTMIMKRNLLAGHKFGSLYLLFMKRQLSSKFSFRRPRDTSSGGSLILFNSILKRMYVLGSGIIAGLIYLYLKDRQQMKVNAKSRWWKREHFDGATLTKAIEKSRNLIEKHKADNNCPGISVAVSVDGHTVWSEATGYADLENHVPFHTNTKVKIASISKPLTTVAALKLFDMGALDLDADIRDYVKEWPQKMWNGKNVLITPRYLLSHLGGIRDYKKLMHNTGMHSTDDDQEFGFEEYYNTDNFSSVTESLKLFKDDPLVGQPGQQFQYSTHGFTLLSAVMEGAIGQKFSTIIKGLFQDLALEDTYLDEIDTLIYHRARHYFRNKEGVIVNAPFVDCSCKWAGAGMLSSVIDLVKFGNILLYSFQLNQDRISSNRDVYHAEKANELPGYLKQSTVSMMWTAVPNTSVSWHKDGKYGMGCQIIPFPSATREKNQEDKCKVIVHTGATIGASGVWLTLSGNLTASPTKDGGTGYPQGIVVAILTNIQTAGLGQVALEIAKHFYRRM